MEFAAKKILENGRSFEIENKIIPIKNKKNLKKIIKSFLSTSSLTFLEVKISNSKIKKLPRANNLIKIKKLFMK